MIEPPIAQELLSLAEGLAQLGVEFETHVRVGGDDPDYRYPARYVGPGAADYPPPGSSSER